jgi:hypothetical protein
MVRCCCAAGRDLWVGFGETREIEVKGEEKRERNPGTGIL